MKLPRAKWWVWGAAALAGVLVAASATVTGHAAPMEVTTKDGKVYVGEVSERAGKVEVIPLNPLANGKAVTLKAAEIAKKVGFVRDAALTEFQKRKANAPADDADKQRELADWALERGLTAQATALLSDLAGKDDRAAKITLAQLQALTEAATPKTTPMTKTDPTSPSTPTALGESAKELPATIDGERAIKLIWLREYGAEDKVVIRVDRKKVVRKDEKDDPYKDYVGFNPATEELIAATRTEGLKDGTFLDPLNVSPEPAVVRDWSRTIQGAIVRGCATNKCHGGGAGVKFQLLTKDLAKPGVAMANFDYLRRYADGGLVRPGFPAESRLLVLGLKAADKKAIVGLPAEVLKHPEVPAFGVNSFNYNAVKDWIARLKPYIADTPPAPMDTPKPPADTKDGM